jgi:hypothetical protein
VLTPGCYHSGAPRTRTGTLNPGLLRADGCEANPDRARRFEKTMQDRAHRLSIVAAHPRTSPEVASRIRSSVRRVERHRRLSALAAHPNTNAAVARRIRLALTNQASPQPPAA